MNLADGAEFIEPGDVERLRNVDNLSVQVEKQAVELEDWIADLVPAPVAAQRVAGVLDQDQPVLGRQPSERFHGERISAETDGRDGPDPALLRLLNFPQLRLRLDGVETEDGFFSKVL